MINSSFGYLFTLASIASFFIILERKNYKIFIYIPAVIFIYALSMALAAFGFFSYTDAIDSIYKLTKTNLLPAMLFLMLLRIDFQHFLKLGNALIISYILALISLIIGFITVAFLFHFDNDMASAFGALAGSWMGGTANMVAVGSALEVSQGAFGFALVVDSVNYTLWVMLLLFVVPFTGLFNRYTKSDEKVAYLGDIGCSCEMGAKRYWSLILLALSASFVSQSIASYIEFINSTTTIVLVATLLGILGSFTKLKYINGSSEIANTMLYLLIALIGSKAIIEDFSGLGVYIFAGFCILLIHAFIMLVGAKLFKLDLFSISVASLANIGGVASAPILAATHNKALVSVGVLMAIMGYLIGTFGGLFVGKILIGLAG